MKEREMASTLAREVANWLSNDEAQLKFVYGHEVQDEDLEEVLAASVQVLRSFLVKKKLFAMFFRSVSVTPTSTLQTLRPKLPPSRMPMGRKSLWRGLSGASHAIWW